RQRLPSERCRICATRRAASCVSISESNAQFIRLLGKRRARARPGLAAIARHKSLNAKVGPNPNAWATSVGTILASGWHATREAVSPPMLGLPLRLSPVRWPGFFFLLNRARPRHRRAPGRLLLQPPRPGPPRSRRARLPLRKRPTAAATQAIYSSCRTLPDAVHSTLSSKKRATWHGSCCEPAAHASKNNKLGDRVARRRIGFRVGAELHLCRLSRPVEQRRRRGDSIPAAEPAHRSRDGRRRRNLGRGV